jgi:hypothetical protein
MAKMIEEYRLRNSAQHQSQGGRLYFQPKGRAVLTVKEILPMLDTSNLDIFMKESLVKKADQ